MAYLRFICNVLIVFVALYTSGVGATQTELKDIRVWHSPDSSRVVLDFTSKPKYKTFFLDNPARFVIDVYQATIHSKAPNKNTGQFLSKFRLGVPNKGVSRLVLDLQKPVTISTLLLKPVANYNYRLVFDIKAKGAAKPNKKKQNEGAGASASGEQKSNDSLALPSKTHGPLIVVIDAGHGGEDTGALGKRSREKDIVLAIAKRLKAKIDAQPNMEAFLTRKGDYFVSLRKRIGLARSLGEDLADLFISIHADGFISASARGSSVFTLSSKGASSEEARWLANKENAADLAGGISITDRDETLAEVLLDMSMTNTSHESIVFANAVLSELKKMGKVHKKSVEKAGFVVLKSPDIPSILVETAFITNPNEEKLLRSGKHQDKLARAILNGVRNFVKKSPTLSARMAP